VSAADVFDKGTKTVHPWTEAGDEVQLDVVQAALTKEAGNIKRTAEALGVARSHLYSILDKHGLRATATELRRGAGGRPAPGGPRKGTVTGRPRKTLDPT
jgi:transposase-like protein